MRKPQGCPHDEVSDEDGMQASSDNKRRRLSDRELLVQCGISTKGQRANQKISSTLLATFLRTSIPPSPHSETLVFFFFFVFPVLEMDPDTIR